MTITTDQINKIYGSLDVSEEALDKIKPLYDTIMKSHLLGAMVKMLPPEIVLQETLLSDKMPVCNCVISAIILGIKIGGELEKAEQLECLMNK